MVALGALLMVSAVLGFAFLVHGAVVEARSETGLDWALRLAFSMLVAWGGWKLIRYGAAGTENTTAAKKPKDAGSWRREAVIFGLLVLVVLVALFAGFIDLDI